MAALLHATDWDVICLALISRSSTPDEPLGKNPFPEGTPAHQSWTETNLWAKEHLALFQAEMLESRPPEEASPKDILDYALKALAGQFDIWARAFSRNVAPTDQAAGLFEQLLNDFEPAMAANASRFPAPFLPKGLYTTEVRRLLQHRKQYWLGRMLRKVRKRKEAKDEAVRETGGAESVHERAQRRSSVATPILTLKRWKRAKWAAKAGVSKNSVYDYLNGKRNLSFENRQALAEVLGLKPEELPD